MFRLPSFGPLAHTDQDTSIDGFLCTVLDNGAVSRVRAMKDGEVRAELRLRPGQAWGRYEDSANVEEYKEGVLSAYGGRYDHESTTRLRLEQWVREKVRVMKDDWFSEEGRHASA